MTTLKRILLLTALAAVLGVAGCGGDEEEGAPIPADTATALENELDNVQARLDNGSAGACRDILEGSRGPNLERVRELLDSLPDDVDPEVRSALEDSFDRLWELVEQDCEDKAEEERQSKPDPEPEPTPTVTEEEPTPTETETAPAPEPTTPEEAPLPPEGDGDNEGDIPGEGNSGGVGPSSSKQKKERAK